MNPLNVFRGPDALKRFFDPDEQPPVPLVELPSKLNPFASRNVHIYAKMLTFLPAQNVKALPAVNMLLHEPLAAQRSVFEVSSGSTVTSLAIANRVLYDNDDTTAYVSNKAAMDRVRELQFFGLRVNLYGGPTYTDTTDLRGPVEWARRLGADNPETLLNLGQYDNPNNWKSHERWTGPQILKQLPDIDVFCMGMGSTGCITGTGRFLKEHKPSVRILGVCNIEADIVPGPRELPMHETSPFPWKRIVDDVETVSAKESYRLSMQLSRNGIICGPSSGMAYKGLLQHLHSLEEQNILDCSGGNSKGKHLHCVFVCCDLPQKHMDSYFTKLSSHEFKEIGNKSLFHVDQHVYSFRWELDSDNLRQAPLDLKETIAQLQFTEDGDNSRGSLAPAPSSFRCIDLRSQEDYRRCHVVGSYNSPLTGISIQSCSVFDFSRPEMLEHASNEIDAMLEDAKVRSFVAGQSMQILVLDYDGNASRVMTAALRARGVKAYSFRSGMNGLQRQRGEVSISSR